MATRTREELLKFIIATEGDDEIKGLVKDLIKLGDSSDASAAKANALLGKIESLGQASKNVQAFTKLKASLTEFGEKITAANKKVTELEVKLAADPGSAGLQRQLDRARVAAIELEKEQNRLSAQLTRTSNALAKEGIDTAKLGTAFQDLQAKMGKARSEAAGFTNEISKSGKATADAGDGIGKLGDLSAGAASAVAGVATQLATVAITATAAAAAVTAVFFKGAIDSAIEFDDALTEVAAVSGAAGDALERLRVAAEEGGAATKFSVVEAAQGLGELARATGDADSAIAALTPSLNLAQASSIGVAEAATILSTTLTQFGLGFDQAAKVADLLTTGANSTSASVSDLGLSLSYAAPLARQLGLSAQDTVAIIAALAEQGFKGEKAGTALRNVFSALLDPADAFGIALRELGIESTNFNEVIEQLATKGNAGRDAILKLDAAARPAILSLVSAGTGGIKKLNEALSENAGESARVAEVMGRSFSAAQEHLSGSFDKARRDLVEPLLQPVIVELNKLAEEFNRFAASEDFRILKAELQSLFAEAGLAVKDFLGEVDFTQAVTDIRQFVVDSKQSIAEFRESIGAIVAVIETVGDGLSFVFNAVQTVISGAAALIAQFISTTLSGFALIIAPVKALREALGLNNDALEEITIAAEIFGDVAKKNGQEAYENLGEAGGALVDLAGQAEESSSRTTAALDQTKATTEATAVATKDLAAAASESADGINKQTAAAEDAAGKMDALAEENERAAQRIKTAFSDLGLKTQAELNNTANSAKQNFEVIVRAAGEGKAATEDVRRAFVAYAQAAIAAAKDSAKSARDRVAAELSVKAASLGVSDALAQMGIAGIDAAGKIISGANQASAAVSSIGDSAAHATAKTDELADASQNVKEKIEQTTKAQDGFTASLGEGSALFHQINEEANRFAVAGLNNFWRETINQNYELHEQQKNALAQATEEVRKQNLQYDETEQKLVELRKQYVLLSDNELRGFIQQQDALEKNLEKQKQINAEKNNKGRAPVETSTGPTAASRSSRSISSSSAESVIVIRFEVGDDRVDLYHYGDDQGLRRTLEGINAARIVSVRK